MSATLNLEAIALAAQSSDPTLRMLAAHRMEMQREAENLDAFFSQLATLTERAKNAKIAAELDAIPGETGTMPKADFIESVRNIILKAGRPLNPGAIFVAFKDLHPEFSGGGADAMRRRLHALKDHFRSPEFGTWWPLDVALPGAVAA